MSPVATVGALLALTTVSTVLLARRPRHPVSLVLAVMAWASLLMPVAADHLVDPLWGLSVLPLAALLIAFPDGPRGRRWTWVFWYTWAAITVAAISGLVAGASGAAQLRVVAGVAAASLVPIAAAAVVSLVRLGLGSHGQRRGRVGLVLAAGAVVVVPYVSLLPLAAAMRWLRGSDLTAGAVGMAVEVFYGNLAFALVPIAVGVSMLLEPVGRRWGWLEAVWPWLFAIGTALAVGGTAGELARARGVASEDALVGWSVLAVVLTTMGVLRLLSIASARWSAPRDRTMQLLGELTDRLDSAPEPDAVPALVSTTVGTALGLRGAAVDAAADAGRWLRLATWGSLDGDEVVRPLLHGGEPVGRLVLVAHPDGVPIDLAALDPLLPSVAGTVAATGLAQRLTAAYQRESDVRDSERERLRADLHDELSPRLAGIRLSLHAARSLIRAGAPGERLEPQLARAERDLAAAGAVIRGILLDLRPDDLDRGGLITAVRSRASDFDEPGTFSVSVDVQGPLPTLAPGTEAAVLRVASEALTNAARHSGGSRCQVGLTRRGDGLLLTVQDDGAGVSRLEHGGRIDPRGSGLGLASMNNRAAAAGGWLTLGAAPAGGTTVTAWFPSVDACPPAPAEPMPALERAGGLA